MTPADWTAIRLTAALAGTTTLLLLLLGLPLAWWLARIAEGFAKVSGHTLKLSSGATGKFYAQVVAGAPFEVLLAADDETPRRLLTEGHGVPGSAFTYAIGRLVLWSARPGFVDDQGAVLAGSGFEHLAIANPKVAPYGQAAVQVLKARGQLERLTPRLVTGETIAQAYQFLSLIHI